MKRTKLFPIILSSILFSSCYSMFQSKIPMTPDLPRGSLQEMLVPLEEVTSLPATSQLFVSQFYNNKIEVAWKEVPGAESYRLERYISTDGTIPTEDSEFEVIRASRSNPIASSSVFGTHYTDYVVTDPKFNSEEYTYTYYYRVYAQSAKIKYDNNPCNSIQITKANPGRLFSACESVKASAGDYKDRVIIKWSHVTGADRYIIMRSTLSGAGGATKIKECLANTFEYTDIIEDNLRGKDLYYVVYAQNRDGELSVQSPIAMGYTAVDGAPSAVTEVKIVKGKGDSTDEIKITWKSTDSFKYRIYRSSSSDSSLSLLADLGEGTSEYTDKKSLRKNTLYYYQVMAYKYAEDGVTELKGPLSKTSPSDSVDPHDVCEAFLLSPPVNIAVLDFGNEHQLQFDIPVGGTGSKYNSEFAEAQGSIKDYTYKLTGCDTIDGYYEEITGVNGGVLSDSSTYIIHNETKKKFYKLITISNGKESAESEIVAPAPEAARNLAVTRAAKISGYCDNDAQANMNGVFPVQLTWDAPEGGADGGYHVYRSTRSDSGYRKITESPVTSLSYVDVNDSAKTGVYYYYKILSLNELKDGANYSLEAYGYGALTADQYMREYNKTIKSSLKKLTLMHKADDMKKLGVETAYGNISGQLYYDAGGESKNFTVVLNKGVIMTYSNYVDFYITNTTTPYFVINGNTNTKTNASKNGNMFGTVNCTGMYPGQLLYDNVQIKGGAAGGGYYVIIRDGFPSANVDYTVGNE